MEPEKQEKPVDAADSESGSVRSVRPGEGKLVRQLKNRHVAMIRYANLSTNTHKSSLTPLSVLEVSSALVSPSS